MEDLLTFLTVDPGYSWDRAYVEWGAMFLPISVAVIFTQLAPQLRHPTLKLPEIIPSPMLCPLAWPLPNSDLRSYHALSCSFSDVWRPIQP